VPLSAPQGVPQGRRHVHLRDGLVGHPLRRGLSGGILRRALHEYLRLSVGKLPVPCGSWLCVPEWLHG